MCRLSQISADRCIAAETVGNTASAKGSCGSLVEPLAAELARGAPD
jgi:hypothetical protein